MKTLSKLAVVAVGTLVATAVLMALPVGTALLTIAAAGLLAVNVFGK
jgi:hypothetical protein